VRRVVICVRGQARSSLRLEFDEDQPFRRIKIKPYNKRGATVNGLEVVGHVALKCIGTGVMIYRALTVESPLPY
jgi:hypothetical protein